MTWQEAGLRDYLEVTDVIPGNLKGTVADPELPTRRRFEDIVEVVGVESDATVTMASLIKDIKAETKLW